MTSARLTRLRRAVVVVTATVASSLLVAVPPASAHDQLIESHPAAGETIAVAPEAIILRFSSDVSDLSTQIVLRGPAGDLSLDSGSGVVVDGPTVTAPLPTDLADGPYSVAWRVVSADGHPVQGELTFTLLTPAPLTATATATATATPVETSTPFPSAPTDEPSAPPPTTSNPLDDAPTGWVLALVGVGLIATVTVLVVRRRRDTV